MSDPTASAEVDLKLRPFPRLRIGKPTGLLARLICLAALLALELTAICAWFDTDLADDNFRHWGAIILRFVVVSAVLLASAGWVKAKIPLRQISARCIGAPIKVRFLLAHCFAMAAFGLLSARLFRNHSLGLQTSLLAAGWLATGMLAIAFAAFAFAPPKLWWAAFRATGNVWIYALLAGMLASLLGKASQLLWAPATHVTFVMVETMLRLLVAGATSDSATRTIGTRSFIVEIDQRCSGLEGAGLMVVTGALWLWLFRRDFRFPQAVLLIPAGVACLFLLNAVRIVALILIGNAGAQDIAVRGFHSQAGWIAFNGVALALLLVAPRIPWFAPVELAPVELAPGEPAPGFTAKGTASSIPETDSADPNPYLIPFMVLLAAGMIAAATAGNFEWLYPLRFFAAAVTLTFFWRKYRDLDWRVSWLAPVTGIFVFLVWIGLDRFTATSPDAMPASLVAASPLARDLWLVCRVLAATVTVPLVEELAFRGFLYRRLISSDFESVSFRRFSWLALVISSAIFGFLHGDHWFVGAVASVLYTLVVIRRGSLGDAVAAHATTNALLAADVLALHHWHLW